MRLRCMRRRNRRPSAVSGLRRAAQAGGHPDHPAQTERGNTEYIYREGEDCGGHMQVLSAGDGRDMGPAVGITAASL